MTVSMSLEVAFLRAVLPTFSNILRVLNTPKVSISPTTSSFFSSASDDRSVRIIETSRRHGTYHLLLRAESNQYCRLQKETGCRFSERRGVEFWSATREDIDESLIVTASVIEYTTYRVNKKTSRQGAYADKASLVP